MAFMEPDCSFQATVRGLVLVFRVTPGRHYKMTKVTLSQNMALYNEVTSKTNCLQMNTWLSACHCVASDETPSIRSQHKHNEWCASCLAGRLEKQECDGEPPLCKSAVGQRFYGVLSTSNSHLCSYTQHHVCGWFFFILVCTKSWSGNRTGESPESSFRCLQSWSNTSLNLCTAPMPEIWNWKKGGKQQYGNTKASFECGGENLKSDFEMVPSDEITQKALTFLALTFPQRPSGVLDSGS